MHKSKKKGPATLILYFFHFAQLSYCNIINKKQFQGKHIFHSTVVRMYRLGQMACNCCILITTSISQQLLINDLH